MYSFLLHFASALIIAGVCLFFNPSPFTVAAKAALHVTVIELGVIILFLVSGYTVLRILASWIARLVVAVFGRPVYLCFTSIGTILHEVSHAIVCLVFLHKIHHIKLLSLSSSEPAYVRHSWNPKSWYQSIGNFFIGIAPGATCGIIIYFLSRSVTWPPVFSTAYIQGCIICCLAVGAFGDALIPSFADIKNGGKGLIVLAVYLYAFTAGLLTWAPGFTPVTGWLTTFFTVVVKIVGAELIIVICLILLWQTKRLLTR